MPNSLTDKPRILCVLPAFNEEGKIGRVVRKILAVGIVEKIIVADDCSTDNTNQEAVEAGAEVLRHETNMGVGAGIRSGIMYGLKNNFNIVVIMSGDDQHEPKELPLVLEPLLRNQADFVQGSRRMKGGRTVNGPLFREITTRLFSLIFTILTTKWISDGTNGFRAFDLKILKETGIKLDQSWLNTYELEPYLLYKAVVSPDIRVVEVPITVYYHEQAVEYSKMKPFRDWWRLARPMFYLRFGIRS